MKKQTPSRQKTAKKLRILLAEENRIKKLNKLENVMGEDKKTNTK